MTSPERAARNTEARARGAATKAGMRAVKSRRALSLDNFGGFMLVDERNCVVAGGRHELSSDDVLEMLASN